MAVLISIWSCSGNNNKEEDKNIDSPHVTEINTFLVQNGRYYGYEILIDGKVFIHQEQIPALKGIQYFQTEELAMKVGTAVKNKLDQNKHPGLTIEEVTLLIGNQ